MRPRRSSPSAIQPLEARCLLSAANAPTFILDFKDATQGITSDRDGNAVSSFDVTQFGFRADQFYELINGIFAEVNDDYFEELNSTIAVFYGPRRELNVNFMVGDIGSAPAGVSEYYYVQIGSAFAGDIKNKNYLGRALLTTSGGPSVRDVAGQHPQEVPVGSIVASICPNNIYKGLQSILKPGDWTATINAISSTISHEIGHTLSLTHVDYSTAVQPTNVPPLMGTGAGIDPTPNTAQLKDQSFSITGYDRTDNNGDRFKQIDQLVTSLGLRSASPETLATLVEDEVVGGGIGFGSDGSYPGEIVNVGGVVYFSADDGIHGRELWRINKNGIAESVGTSGSSHEIAPGPEGSNPHDLTVVGDTLFFSAHTSINRSDELWRVRAGGNAELVSGPGLGLISPELNVAFGDALFVTAKDGNGYSAPYRLFRVSSTGPATYVKTPDDGFFTSGYDFCVVDGILYFSSSRSVASPDGLWRIKGSGLAEPVSTGGTLSDPRFGVPPRSLIDFDGVLYFLADGRRENEGHSLWRLNASGVEMIHFDGVAAGTHVTGFQEVVEIGGTLFFTAGDGINGVELWRLNASGIAEMVDDAAAGAGIVPGKNTFGPQSLTNVNGTLYFIASYQSSGHQLWRVTPTGNAEVVDDVIPGRGYWSPEDLTVVGDTLYFAANVDEIWRINSKGRAEGVPAFKGNFASGVYDLTVSNGTLYFIADKGSRQLWKVDQLGVIVPVAVIVGGTPSKFSLIGPKDLVDVNGELFAVAHGLDGTESNVGEELWRIQNDQNVPPVIGGFGTVVTYKTKGTNLVLAPNATVTGTSSKDFAGGTLVVRTLANGDANDRFGIRNVGTAVSQIGVSGNEVLFSGMSIGTFTGTTTLTIAFNAKATAAAVQALLRNIVFSNVSATPSTKDRAVRITITDGDGGLTNSPTMTVKVTTMNDAPVVGGIAGSASYAENSKPVVIASAATVVDPDSINLSTGKLTVSITKNGQVADRIGIRHVGTAAGQIGVSGTSVRFGGVVIGTFAGTTSLVVTLNGAATPAAVQALLRNITYSSVSDAPSTLDRIIKVTLTDGDGGTSNSPTKTVKVIGVNDAPVIGGVTGSVNYIKSGTPALIASTATVVDPDSVNLATGKLTVAITKNAQSTDRIGIRNIGPAAGQIGVSGTSVRFGGVTIGTFAGTTSLVVTLNSAATPAAVQALLRNITYSSISNVPSTLDRTIKVTLTDGDGGTSSSQTKIIRVVAVNKSPVIGGVSGSVSYAENSKPVVIASAATVVDPDSINLSTGKLTASITKNGQSTDRIGIRHVGTAAGQIGVSGTSVRYGGVTIGTFAGTTSLVVTLNSAATPARVQALLRSITYSTVSNAPSTLERTIKVTLTDGDGGTSNSPTKTVKVTAINDAPVLSGVSGTVSYIVKGKPVVIATTATVADADSTNLSGGKLTVSISKNAQSSDRLGIKSVGSAAGQIALSGRTVRFAGIAFGTFSGTSTLTVNLSTAATPAAVQALMRSITYSSISTAPSILDRTIKFTLTDGDGGTSNSPTRIVKVVRSTAFALVAPPELSRRSTFPELDQLFADDAILTTILSSR